LARRAGETRLPIDATLLIADLPSVDACPTGAACVTSRSAGIAASATPGTAADLTARAALRRALLRRLNALARLAGATAIGTLLGTLLLLLFRVNGGEASDDATGSKRGAH
jgi:hypothetical protein